MKKLVLILGCLTLSLSTVSCDKFLDIEPEGKVIPKSTDDYRKLMTTAYFTYPRHKALLTVRTDEVQIPTTDNSDFTEVRDVFAYNDQNPSELTREYGYSDLYKVIFYANQTINDGSGTMQAGDAKEQLLGEAHALRALAYFDLVNFFAKPYDPATAATEPGIVIQNELDIENKRPKSTVAQVYAQIHADIDAAKNKLKVTTYDAGMNYRFSKLAIYALEARVNLYQKDYQAALESAEQALKIKNTLQNLNENTDLAVTNFKSPESIMNLEDVFKSGYLSFIFASEELKASFDKENDWRYGASFDEVGDNTIATKVGNGDTKISFRTAELYFIKAEAHLFLNQIDQATASLQPVIESRYKTEAVPAVIEQLKSLDVAAYKTYLLEERFREFAFEGQRWFDLRRLNQKKIVHKLGNEEFTLQQNDPRYTLPFPRKARETTQIYSR